MSVTTHKLQLGFLDTNSENVTFNYSHAKNNPASADVKALMQGMITNNAIWQKNPATMSSATLVTTTKTAIDIS